MTDQTFNELREHLKTLVSFDELGYDEPQENTLMNVADNLWNECASHSQGKNNAEKFTDALRGLPSYIAIPFYNFDIENLMKAIGYEGTNAVDEYWNACGQILANSFENLRLQKREHFKNKQ